MSPAHSDRSIDAVYFSEQTCPVGKEKEALLIKYTGPDFYDAVPTECDPSILMEALDVLTAVGYHMHLADIKLRLRARLSQIRHTDHEGGFGPTGAR